MKKLLILAAVCGLFCVQNLHATCSNPASYVDGNTLTAGELNTDFGLVATCVDDVLNGDTFTGSISIHSGFDLLMYSDTGTTLKASIDGATGATIAGLTQAGQLTNCGISVSGTTFTIAGYEGTALSATNPCVVAVRSNTAGRVALAYFTSNVTFTFGSASDTDGNLFGITDANWASAMPFFIGVVYDGTTPYFTISRVPQFSTGSNDTDVCQKADTDCDAQEDTMILATGLTLSSFHNKNITQVGFFKMTYATSGGAWTASVPMESGFNDKVGSTYFSMPTDQGTGGYFNTNSGTPPAFSGYTYTYTINSDGECTVYFYFSNDGGTDGSGAVSAQLSTPYSFMLSSAAPPLAYGDFYVTLPSSLSYSGVIQMTPPNRYFVFLKPSVSGTALQNTIDNLKYSDFGNGTRILSGQIKYSVSR